MGDKVCGLCVYYKVGVFKDELNNKWDACIRETPIKVTSRQVACENYQGYEPIMQPEWFTKMLRRAPKIKAHWGTREGLYRTTKAYEIANKKWWKEYFVKKEEAEKATKKA